MPFSQGMSVPLELRLRASADAGIPYRLCFYPVDELADLSTGQLSGANLNLSQANSLLSSPDLGELLDIQIEFQSDRPVSFDVGGCPITWDPQQGVVSFAGQTAALPPGQEKITLRLLVDRCLTEVFADGGWAAFAAMTLFPLGGRTLRLDGPAENISLLIHKLKSIWG
jgi:hypothetical protein